MARAARDPRRQAARLGLLALATACAAAADPPGGPPDFTAPVLRETRPDSAAILPGFDDPVVFAFDEVITERQPTDLAKLVLISPRPRDVKVSWKRTRLEVKPGEGWRPGVVYRVSLLPGVTDLRNNRFLGDAEVVFSTGPAIPDTRLDAYVLDWTAGRLASSGLVEAWPLPITDDSVAYVGRPDSTGEVHLTRMPPGTYLVVGVVDENGNNRRDRREAFDSATVQLDSVASHPLWAFVHDTVGPPLRDATRLDSLTVRLTFAQPLGPAMDPAGTVIARLLPDSTPVEVAAVWTGAVYDSIARAETAARDSAQRAAADSTAPRDSTAGPDTTQAQRAAPPTAAPPARVAERPPRAGRVAQAPTQPARGVGRGAGDLGAQQRASVVDTARVNALLRQRPALDDRLVVRLASPLLPGARYLFDATATNANGATAQTRTMLVVPDTAAAAAPQR